MKRRKLMTSNCYGMITAKQQLGVSMSRITRDLAIANEISRPSLIKLVKHYNTMMEQGPEAATIHASLFPDWLNHNGSAIQEQPEDWRYEGYFPLGEWLHEDN